LLDGIGRPGAQQGESGTMKLDLSRRGCIALSAAVLIGAL